MDMQNLIHMANQIGDFFETMPDREESLCGIAKHLQNFWEPRMRSQLLEHMDEKNGAGLNPLVREAIRIHRDDLLSHNA
jgi:formate dehydrogenase subunit delta